MKPLTRDASKKVMISPLRNTEDEMLRPELQEIDDLGSPSRRALLAIPCLCVKIYRNTYCQPRCERRASHGGTRGFDRACASASQQHVVALYDEPVAGSWVENRWFSSFLELD
jgi:hypothetical protein